MSYHKEKLEKRIRAALSQMLVYDLEDPRLQSCLINRVRLSKDLRIAKVYVSFFGGERAETKGLQALRSASKYIQSLLTNKLQVRYVPLLSFFVEENPEERLQSLQRIDKILSEESRSTSEDEKLEASECEQKTQTKEKDS